MSGACCCFRTPSKCSADVRWSGLTLSRASVPPRFRHTVTVSTPLRAMLCYCCRQPSACCGQPNYTAYCEHTRAVLCYRCRQPCLRQPNYTAYCEHTRAVLCYAIAADSPLPAVANPTIPLIASTRGLCYAIAADSPPCCGQPNYTAYCEHTRAVLCYAVAADSPACCGQPNYTAYLLRNAPLRCGYFLVERCCPQRACLRKGLHVLPCSALAIGAGPQRSAVLGWVRCNLVQWSVAWLLWCSAAHASRFVLCGACFCMLHAWMVWRRRLMH